MAGFADLETTFQYQLLKDAPHELAMLLGLIVDWGGTGATNAGIGTSYGTLTPTFYFGKGFGDLPDTMGWVRPFALTGQAGYRDSTSSYDLVQGALIPQVMVYGGSLQYSLPYLKSRGGRSSSARLHQSSDPAGRSKFVDAGRQQYGQQLPHDRHDQSGSDLGRQLLSDRRRGEIPINRDSGTGVGVLAQLHLYLDDMFPSTLGQPLIGGTSTAPRKSAF